MRAEVHVRTSLDLVENPHWRMVFLALRLEEIAEKGISWKPEVKKVVIQKSSEEHDWSSRSQMKSLAEWPCARCGRTRQARLGLQVAAEFNRADLGCRFLCLGSLDGEFWMQEVPTGKTTTVASMLQRREETLYGLPWLSAPWVTFHKKHCSVLKGSGEKLGWEEK
jgi:hypothetical protein